MKNANISFLSLPNAVISNLSLRKKRDPRYQLSGMTSEYTPEMARARAFTLIELLVVVLIIGILSAIALPQYQVAVLKSRYVAAKMMGASLVEAEEVFYLANGEYTEDLEQLDIEVSTSGAIRCDVEDLNKIRCKLYQGETEIMMLQWYLPSTTMADAGARWCVTRSTDLSAASNKICANETADKNPTLRPSGTGYIFIYQ